MHDVTHTAFFGDQQRDFVLTAAMVLELERKIGSGIGSIYRRVLALDFSSTEVVEVIRLGLIGSGTNPEEASNLIDAYVAPFPLSRSYALAVDILEARMTGKSPVQQIAPETEIVPDAE